MTVRVGIEGRFQKRSPVLRLVQDHLHRASDLTPAMSAAVDIVEDSIREEFEGRFWKTPSGGTQGWAPRKDKKSHPLLRLTGALFDAWMGGSGSVRFARKHSFLVGVDGASIPDSKSRDRPTDWPAVHRGGSGRNVQTSPVHKGIKPRPHATHSPELDARIRDAITGFILTGKVK